MISKKRGTSRGVRLVAVFLGGCFGAVARDGLSHAYPTTTGSFPLTTLAINLVGALVLGFVLEFLLSLGEDTGWRQMLRLGVGSGFCGGFTTYSTLVMETDLLIGSGGVLGWIYIIVSVAAGIALALLGIRLARLVSRLREASSRRDDPEEGGMR